MLIPLLKKELIGFFGVVMNCFFNCFLVRDSRLRRKTFPSKTTEPVVSRNHLSSLLQAEEEKESSTSSTPEKINEGRILKDEAWFLKACGTIAQTPIEIQKMSKRCKDVSHSSKGSVPFRFHSWFPNISIEKLILEGEKWVNDEEYSEHTPSSSTQANEAGSASDCTSSTRTPSGTVVAVYEQFINKSVRFKFKDDVASSSSASSSSGNGGLYSKQRASEPYPTPLKLTAEMETPGTVFPANFDGKDPRIRSQYVYSALNPVENLSQLKLIKDDERELGVGERTEGKKNLVRPPPCNRPIIGLVVAHWIEEEEVSRISPKYWDGNGIPNSKNKYKEDQKVIWHATPFEERLEKALSGESSMTLRKDINLAAAIDFEDIEENDTALSQRQSTYSRPMVSF